MVYVTQSVFLILPHCFSVVFPRILEKDFRLLIRGLLLISRLSSIPLTDLINMYPRCKRLQEIYV